MNTAAAAAMDHRFYFAWKGFLMDSCMASNIDGSYHHQHYQHHHEKSPSERWTRQYYTAKLAP
jgi:hypothetical protein